MNQDLTKGNVTKSLLTFAAPMILGNLLQQCYNIADTWVVGKFVGADALAAVGSSYALMTFLNSLLIGLCMGGGAVFSYYIGKGEREKVRACAQTAFAMIGVLAAVLMALAQGMMQPILLLLRTPTELYEMTRDYLSVVFWGIFFIFLYNYFAFLLRALGNSVAPLYFLGAASLLNIALDLFFVRSLGRGLTGAAEATVIAQAVSGLGLGIYLWKKEPYFRFSLRCFLREEKPVGEICRYSLVTGMQQSVMNFGILMVQSLVNSFGAAVMAAFAATVKIDTFAYMPAQEFGNAYSIFISQNYGAGMETRVKQGTRKAMTVSAVFCGVISVLVFALARFLMLIFVDAGETEIIEIGMQYLRIEGAFYIGIGILFLWYGYFRGVGRPGVSLVLTVISLGTRVVLAYVLSAVPGIGVPGIWWAIPIGWLLADVTGFVLMRLSGKRNRFGKRLWEAGVNVTINGTRGTEGRRYASLTESTKGEENKGIRSESFGMEENMSKIAVFFGTGYEEIEALTVVDILRRAGEDITMVSITDEQRVTSSHGVEVTMDKILSEMNFNEVDVIVLPGGMPGTKNLEACETLMGQVDAFVKAGKIVAAVCAAPSILGHRGHLKGKKACSFPDFESHLEGADVRQEPAVIDGNIITGRGMGAAISFGLAILEKLQGKEAAETMAAKIVFK